MRHMLSLLDWSAGELASLIERAAAFKAAPHSESGALAGRTLAMVFQKPSTRTRVSFEIAMQRLGGHALFLSAADLQLGRGETIADTARVLARYCDAIMARVHDHADVEGLTVGGVPVINGLSERLHPCQALADVLTLRERFGSAEGLEVAYLGDGDNVCHSLIHASVRFGFRLRVATPETFAPLREIVDRAREQGGEVTITHDAREAVDGARAVYTDVWASMGHEAEMSKRRRIFEPFRVDEALFARAAPDAVFLHCLPAHRGEEVTDGVMEHERSLVFDQAENRLHTEQALLFTLLTAA
jgi:ornithine carbamoyltransferase